MTDHFCVECEAGYVGERCPSCGSTPLVFTSRDADAIESDRDLYKQQRDELLAALEPVAEIAAELEAKGYFDDCWEEANVYPNDVELSVADLKRARRAAERVRKGQ